jgi:hypothetical protein
VHARLLVLRCAAREGKNRGCSSAHAAAAGGPLCCMCCLENSPIRVPAAQPGAAVALTAAGIPWALWRPLQVKLLCSAERARGWARFDSPVSCRMHSQWPLVSSGRGSTTATCMLIGHELLRALTGRERAGTARRTDRNRGQDPRWSGWPQVLLANDTTTSFEHSFAHPPAQSGMVVYLRPASP